MTGLPAIVASITMSSVFLMNMPKLPEGSQLSVWLHQSPPKTQWPNEVCRLVIKSGSSETVVRSYTFTPSGAVVVSDFADPRQPRATSLVHFGHSVGHSASPSIIQRVSKWLNRLLRQTTPASELPNFCYGDFLKRDRGMGFGGALTSQISRVLPCGPESLFVRVANSFANHSGAAQYYLDGWETCVPIGIEDETSGMGMYGRCSPVCPCVVSPCGKLVLCDSGHVIRIPECILERKMPGPIWNTRWFEGQRYLVTEAKSQSFLIWNASFMLLARIGQQGPDIATIALSYDGALCATASSTRWVRVWISETGKRLSKTRFDCAIASLTFNSQPSTIEVSLVDGRTVAWNYASPDASGRNSHDVGESA